MTQYLTITIMLKKKIEEYLPPYFHIYNLQVGRHVELSINTFL